MENKEVDIEKKHERIDISDLKEIDPNEVYPYPELRPRKDYDDFKGSEEEKKKLEEEEKKKIIEKKSQIKNKSLGLHYNINEEKKKELESTFRQMKLKIELSGKPQILRDGKIISLSTEGFTIYDSVLFKKIAEIKLEQPIKPEFAIELDNGDLIIACKNDDDNMYNYQLLVYRFKDQQYFLLQKIKEGGLGLTAKYYITGHCSYSRQYHKLDYKISELKKISGNRFFCLSNTGLKMYSLNEKNEYSLVLIEDELEDLGMIHEVNENKFIFSVQKVHTNYFYSTIEMYLGTIELKNATKEELDKKLALVKEKGYQSGKKGGYCHKYNMFGFPIFRGPEVEEKEEIQVNFDDELKKIIESLKYSCSIKATQKYNSNSNLQLSDSIIIKNKYLIIVIGVNILIIDLNEGKELKTYELLIDGIFEGNDSLFMPDRIEMKKWCSAEDNQFIFIIGKNAILVELTEVENDIQLKILNYSYFPNIMNSQNLKILSEKNNKFCCLSEESRSFYEKSNSNSISIY